MKHPIFFVLSLALSAMTLFSCGKEDNSGIYGPVDSNKLYIVSPVTYTGFPGETFTPSLTQYTGAQRSDYDLGANPDHITMSSSNSSVADVGAAGTVTLKAPGECKINFKDAKDKQIASISVTVNREIVLPSSECWDKNELSEGLLYYTFKGEKGKSTNELAYDPVTDAYQVVNVVSLDLNNSRYQFKFHYGRDTTSRVLATTKQAVVTMNATYEQASIIARVDNNDCCTMKSSTISSTGVPNWKNEGCVTTDGQRGVNFIYNDVYVKDPTDEDIQKQRDFFNKIQSPNIFSSAPVLIHDYEPLGSSYIIRMGYDGKQSISSFNSEHPVNHQGVRHPRSVVALTADNRLLLFTVDGRTTYSSGMNADEITRFLVKHFDPKFALNMDGGGSTTMCVLGYGQTGTNVVNYPTDNGGHNHFGQRTVPTHFIIIDTQK